MKRSAPMKRTGFARKEPKPFALADRKTTLQRSAMKRRVKKPTVAEGSKYLAACRGEPCFLNVMCPWTDWEDPTVVPCHSNFAKHGKAGALKAEHRFSVPGCYACHSWLDAGPAPYEQKVEKFDDALSRWQPIRARKMGTEQQESA